MIAELGVFFLILALLVAILQTAYLLPVYSIRAVLERILPLAAWLQALCVVSAFVLLVILRLNSDFSVVNVVSHSNLSLPTLYKIVGTWGNHEGSMLLWVLVLSLFGALIFDSREKVKLYAAAIQSILSAGFLLFILCTSSPFARNFPPTIDGEALNPLLQDIGLAIHPPLLYFGYVGFSIVFSLSVAALIVGRADREWAYTSHKWIMLSWSALTLGIGLGSWWAYRELGWGGWWFWDPVENASLLPWLAGTALFHSNIVLKKRGMLAQWVVLLSIITFALSLLGTFLVRSGAITSVHSFASDPQRGIFILAYIVVTVGGALFLFALRGGRIESSGQMLPVSREGFIVINNLFLLSVCATVLLGTLYPIFVEIAGGEKVTVGAPFFQVTFVPMIAISLVFAALTPFMAWKKANMNSVLLAIRPVLLVVLAVIFLVLAFVHEQIISAICGFALAAWLAAGSLQWLVRTRKVRGRYAVFLGHIGVACMVVGVTASSLWKEEVQRQAEQGEVLHIAGYTVNYVGRVEMENENYSTKQVELHVEDRRGRKITNLFPEYRKYIISGSNTSETAIHYGLSGDLYAVVGETLPDGRTAIRLYFQPLVSFIWLGFILMAVGGVLSISQNSLSLWKREQKESFSQAEK